MATRNQQIIADIIVINREKGRSTALDAFSRHPQLNHRFDDLNWINKVLDQHEEMQ